MPEPYTDWMEAYHDNVLGTDRVAQLSADAENVRRWRALAAIFAVYELHCTARQLEPMSASEVTRAFADSLWTACLRDVRKGDG